MSARTDSLVGAYGLSLGSSFFASSGLSASSAVFFAASLSAAAGVSSCFLTCFASAEGFAGASAAFTGAGVSETSLPQHAALIQPAHESGLHATGISSPFASASAAFFAFLLLINAMMNASTKNAPGASTNIVIGVYRLSALPIPFIIPDEF